MSRLASKLPIIVLLGYLISCTPQNQQETTNEPLLSDVDSVELIIEEKKPLIYGFDVDSTDLSAGVIRRNQNLSEILSDHNVDYKDIHTLAIQSKEVYDVRKLKAGSKYTIIHDTDSFKTAKKFIFEPSIKEYVVYHLDDSIYAEINERPSEIKEKTLIAEISSSVYNSIIENEASPLLVGKLVDVFAWQVDFFRIDKGDRFKLIYEVEEIDGKVYDIASIKGAYFEHLDKQFYAIPYTIDGETDYYDENGNSLRKTFLKAPLNYSRISSRYSPRRFHPVQKRFKAHLGTDYAAPKGTPIRTVGDGVVIAATYHAGNGNYVKIKHNSNYTTQYLHMSKIASGIKKGQHVKQGQTIGYVGSTGLATGPHLCFRFWKNGRQVDALKVDLPSSKGIDAPEMHSFLALKDSIKGELDQLIFDEKEVLATMNPF